MEAVVLYDVANNVFLLRILGEVLIYYILSDGETLLMFTPKNDPFNNPIRYEVVCEL